MIIQKNKQQDEKTCPKCKKEMKFVRNVTDWGSDNVLDIYQCSCGYSDGF